jgi:glyoxylase-like metal-dependent hydrolase (beta-lactamase superfamily II)
VRAERFESALFETSSLLLADGADAVLVDPCISLDEVARIAARADGLGVRVTAVLATHADWDHVCGIAAFPGAVAAMGAAAARVEDGSAWRDCEREARRWGLELAGPPRVDRVLAAGAAHRIGPFAVETLALPGHTPDGVAYRIRELDLLAVGDHLSAIEFPFASDTAAYRASLAALVELLRRDPPGRIVPGHGPEHTGLEAAAIAEADLDYLWRLHGAVAAALPRGIELARAAGRAVVPPRGLADEEEWRGNVEAQLTELLPP